MKTKSCVGVLLVFLILVTFNNQGVLSQGPPFDCYDACTTSCVQRNTRLMQRCEVKCGIKCQSDPVGVTGGHHD